MQDDKKRRKLVEESLTPDEEHKIEVRVDKMMQVDSPTPDEPADEPVEEVSPEPEAKSAPSLPGEPEDAPAEAEPTSEAETPSEPEATDPAKSASEKVPAAQTPNEEDDELARLAAEPIGEDAPPVEAEAPLDELAAKEHAAELDKHDQEIAAAFASKKPKDHKLKKFFATWWRNKKSRWATIVVFILLLMGAGAWPTSRAWALNLVGVRGSATVAVVDNSTRLPLKNVVVSIGVAHATTDESGNARLGHVKLGHQSLVLEKAAFAKTVQPVTIKLGANNLGSVPLKPAGDQYKLKVTDYLTGKPITSAQAASGQATAVADKNGLITLTANSGSSTLKITVSANGYKNYSVNAPNGAESVLSVQLVLDRSEVYFSNQSGKYDLYKADLDGQHKKLLLPGTGNETSTLSLVQHPTAEEVAIVDTRDGNRDSGGYLLQTLTLINVSTGAPTTIDHSERIIPIDWLGDRLVYVMAKAGASAANPSRYVLMSYDYRTNQRLELDHANAFNDVVSTAGSVYYATSNQYDGGTSQFVRVNADGTNKVTLLNAEVWNILRKDYTNFFLNTGNSNYTYKLGDNKPAATSDQYNSPSRLYIDSPDSKHALWVDQRDGKPTLLVYDLSKQKDTVLVQQDGITYPVRWLSNDTVVYRIKTDNETADYAVGLSSGTGKKITDVTNATGRSLWYFY